MNSTKPWLAIIALFLLTGSSLAQVSKNRQPKSILDYYFSLPHKYLPYLKGDSRPVREAAIRVKDLEGDFLKSGLETDEVSTTVALFKKPDGSEVIAVENRSCPSGCTSTLSLLSYAKDQWIDVTNELLPAIDGDKIQGLLQRQYISRPNEPERKPLLIYNLRKNRSIEVHEHWTGMVLGEYEWANDGFVFKSEDAVRDNYRVLAATDNEAGDSLQIIGVDPEAPATLPLNGHLRIKIAYKFKSGKYGFIWATPVVLEQRLPDNFTNGSMRYSPGSGVTTAWLGFNNEAHLDLLKVTLADEGKKPILTLTYPVDANWKGKRECPTFRISCFPNTIAGGPLACMVYPSGVVPGQEFNYLWNVSGGSIATGQGTRRITINPIAGETDNFKAELEIGNLPSTCEGRASFPELIRPRQ